MWLIPELVGLVHDGNSLLKFFFLKKNMKEKITSGNKATFPSSSTYVILSNFILWNTKVDALNDTFMVLLNQFWNLKASVPITSSFCVPRKTDRPYS